MFLEALVNDDVWVPPVDTPCRIHPDAWSDSLLLRDGYNRRSAAFICRTECPLIAECLASAMKAERGQNGAERCGIRGGLTARERAQKDRNASKTRSIRSNRTTK